MNLPIIIQFKRPLFFCIWPQLFLFSQEFGRFLVGVAASRKSQITVFLFSSSSFKFENHDNVVVVVVKRFV